MNMTSHMDLKKNNDKKKVKMICVQLKQRLKLY